MILDELPIRERELLQNTLLKGERILWLGRADGASHSKITSRLVAGYSLFFLVFFGLFTYGMWESGRVVASIVFACLASGSLVIAVVSPWLYRIFPRELYVLTDLRAIVMKGNKSYLFPRSADMLYNLTRHKNGTVSLELGINPDDIGECKMARPIGFLYLSANEWDCVYKLMKNQSDECEAMDRDGAIAR